MKKYIYVIAVLALLGAGVAKVYADTRTIYNEEKSYLPGDDFRKYIRVKNNSDDGAALSNGQFVIWDIRNATNVGAQPTDRWSVTTSTVASDALFAGVSTESISQGSYGFIQTYGIHNTALTTGVVARGIPVETSGTRGRARSTRGTSTVSYGVAGVALGDQGSDTTSTDVVFVDTK